MVICVDKNRKWVSKKDNLIYSEILFPEILNLFYFSTHQAFYSFEKGKNILFFPKEEKIFFQESMKKIKMEGKFLERDIIPIRRNRKTELCIKKTKTMYFFDKNYSENFWVHRSDANFIYKHIDDNLDNWKLSLKNKISYKEIKYPIHIYLVNQKDKVIYNQFVSTEIINKLKFYFCFGKNKSITVSKEKIPELIKLLKEKEITIISNKTNPIQIFLKEEIL